MVTDNLVKTRMVYGDLWDTDLFATHYFDLCNQLLIVKHYE